MTEFILKDSGDRQTFDTGAKRDMQKGKGRYDLLSPIPARRLAVIMEKGADKYEARNWEKGMPLTRFIDSAKRHLDQFIEGHRDEDHLGQAIWNLCALMHVEEMIKRGILPESLNDLPNYLGSQEQVVKDEVKTLDVLALETFLNLEREIRDRVIREQLEKGRNEIYGLSIMKFEEEPTVHRPSASYHDGVYKSFGTVTGFYIVEPKSDEEKAKEFAAKPRVDRDLILKIEIANRRDSIYGKPFFTYKHEPKGYNSSWAYEDGVIYQRVAGAKILYAFYRVVNE